MPLFIIAQILAWGAGVAWLFFFNSLDKYEKESYKDLLRVFFIGAALALPAGLINAAGEEVFFGVSFGSNVALHMGPVMASFTYYSFIVGIGEELMKFLAVWMGIYKKPQFNEPLDGIIYASAACLGFAFVENIEYFYSFLLAMGEDQAAFSDVAGAIGFRSAFIVPLHVLLGSFWGYNMGLAKYQPQRKNRLIFSGLLFAAFIHGVYDFSLQYVPWYSAIVFVATLFWFFFRKVRYLARISPFNQAAYGLLCPHCQHVVKANDAFCESCGKETKGANSEQRLCLKCHGRIHAAWAFCQNCGENLKPVSSPAGSEAGTMAH